MSNSAYKFIQSVQPYKTVNPATSTLKIIHDLDITDKHRLPIVVAYAASLANVSAITLGSHDTSSCEPIEITNFIPNGSLSKVTDDGVEIARVRLAKPCPGFFAETQFIPRIAIETPAGNVPAVETLTKMLKYTVRTIDSFNGEF